MSTLNFKNVNGTYEATDKDGNKYYMPMNQETCTVHMKDGRKGLGWTAEEALENAKKEKVKKATFTLHYLGYKIINNWNGDNYILVGNLKTNKDFWKTHLGNFKDLMEAKRNALFFYMLERPDLFANQLRNRCLYSTPEHRNGCWGEYSVLTRSLQDDGILLPAEIEKSKDGNLSIMFNGEKF